MDSKDTEVEYEPNNIKSSAKWTGKLKSTKEFIWNSSKGEFIGRTGSSWGGCLLSAISSTVLSCSML